MKRLIGILAAAIITTTSLPLAVYAAPRAERTAGRPVAREAAPRHVERPIIRERAPRAVTWPVVRERVIEPRALAPRYEKRSFERPVAPRVVRERIIEPRVVAPRYVTRHVESRSHRNAFVRYYPRTYARAPVTRERVVFRRYVPQRIFLAPPVQVASIPVSYVYTGYAPVYTTMQSSLPISWAPEDEEDGNINQYASYPSQYGGNQYPYGSQQYGYGQFGAAPFGNAQLQGIVIANTNGGILVMTPSLKPVFVNTSIAQQNGYMNGTISPGSFVNVFGYDTGSEFIATALG